MPNLTSVTKPNGQPYVLTMPTHLSDTHVPFHASLSKIVDFWKFHQLCLPSFLENHFYDEIASRNPNGQQPDKFQGIKHGQDYANSSHKIGNDSLDNYLMPQVSYTDFGYEITYLEKNNVCKRLLGMKENKEVIIAQSQYSIGFTNGRHRLRYFEFIGAQDIFVAVPKHQLTWFQKNCSYP
ncbi:hypothetical protein [Neisseria weaveri]|uniref:hypothetical protein n=1 Tax=Neisseria weaveri TaxID=28091 RepID=UPI00131EC19B|nr:hypothetical protein [Neisseria weaveri]